MRVDGKDIRTIWLDKDEGIVKIIDQRKLPHEFIIADLKTVDDTIEAIQDMYVLRLVDLTAANAAYYEYVDTSRPEPPCLLPEELKDRCGDLPYGSLSGE